MKIQTAARTPAHPSTKVLMVLLHGYGADGHNLIDLGQVWGRKFPYLECIAPNAPFPCEQGMGYQWASLRNYSAEKMAADIQPVFPAIQKYLEYELEKRQLTYKNLILMGFSQGAYLALHMSVFLANQGHVCAGVMGYAGWMTLPPPSVQSPIHFPPILLVHGAADTVVPLQGSMTAKHILEPYGGAISLYICQNLGHSINPEGLHQGERFLKNILSNLNTSESILSDEIS